jgi:hypothetical protein
MESATPYLGPVGGVMSSMTVPEKISDFLSQRQDRMYCDTCIQERLGLKWRQQVQLITATLAVTATFCREFNKCCTCETIKQVTHATGGQSRLPVSPSPVMVQKLGAQTAQRRKRLDTRYGSGRAQGVDYARTGSDRVSALGHDTN